MKELRKQIVVTTKRPLLWMGLLERAFLEFIDARKPKLATEDFDNLFALPAHLSGLVQAGALEAIELRAGAAVCAIRLAEEPGAQDDLDLADVPARQQGRGHLEIVLRLQDAHLAGALGTETLRAIASEQLRIYFRPANEHPPEPEDADG